MRQRLGVCLDGVGGLVHQGAACLVAQRVPLRLCGTGGGDGGLEVGDLVFGCAAHQLAGGRVEDFASPGGRLDGGKQLFRGGVGGDGVGFGAHGSLFLWRHLFFRIPPPAVAGGEGCCRAGNPVRGIMGAGDGLYSAASVSSRSPPPADPCIDGRVQGPQPEGPQQPQDARDHNGRRQQPPRMLAPSSPIRTSKFATIAPKSTTRLIPAMQGGNDGGPCAQSVGFPAEVPDDGKGGQCHEHDQPEGAGIGEPGEQGEHREHDVLPGAGDGKDDKHHQGECRLGQRTGHRGVGPGIGRGQGRRQHALAAQGKEVAGHHVVEGDQGREQAGDEKQVAQGDEPSRGVCGEQGEDNAGPAAEFSMMALWPSPRPWPRRRTRKRRR